MTNLPSLRGALAFLTLAVLLAATAARADGMGFFGVPSADEETSAPVRPAARHHAAAHKPVAHAAQKSAARQPVSQAAAPSRTKSYAAHSAAKPAAARPIALAALPAPKAAAPQPARNTEDEGLVELVEAPRRSYASR